MSRYQKGTTDLDLTGARDSEWQWYQQGHMQVCTSLQTDNHASTPPLSFLQAGCPSCRPTTSQLRHLPTQTSTISPSGSSVQKKIWRPLIYEYPVTHPPECLHPTLSGPTRMTHSSHHDNDDVTNDAELTGVQVSKL